MKAPPCPRKTAVLLAVKDRITLPHSTSVELPWAAASVPHLTYTSRVRLSAAGQWPYLENPPYLFESAGKTRMVEVPAPSPDDLLRPGGVARPEQHGGQSENTIDEPVRGPFPDPLVAFGGPLKFEDLSVEVQLVGWVSHPPPAAPILAACRQQPEHL